MVHQGLKLIDIKEAAKPPHETNLKLQRDLLRGGVRHQTIKHEYSFNNTQIAILCQATYTDNTINNSSYSSNVTPMKQQHLAHTLPCLCRHTLCKSPIVQLLSH